MFYVIKSVNLLVSVVVCPVPVILLLQLLHLTLQEQQLLASDGRGGGVRRIVATQLLLQGAILHLQGSLLLHGHGQLQGESRKKQQKQTVWRKLRANRRSKEVPTEVGIRQTKKKKCKRNS